MANDESDAKRWFDQAWADWIQPLGVLILAVIAYVLYHFDLVGESVAGIVLVLTILLGVLSLGLFPALGLARRGSDRATVFVLAVLALGGSAWPTLRLAYSPAPLASTSLNSDLLKATLTTGSDGPYEVVVSGRFKQPGASEVEAGYTLKISGQGEDEITGEIARTMHRYRTSRRGGTTSSLEEHTEKAHRLEHVRGGQLTVSTDGIDDQLDGALDVSIRAAGPRPEIFWTLAALAVLLALFLDVRLVSEISEDDRKVRGPRREQTYLTVVTAMLLVFSINFPMEATPRSLVRAAVGAFFLALLLGGAGGWMLSSFVRIAAKPRRRRA